MNAMACKVAEVYGKSMLNDLFTKDLEEFISHSLQYF